MIKYAQLIIIVCIIITYNDVTYIIINMPIIKHLNIALFCEQFYINKCNNTVEIQLEVGTDIILKLVGTKNAKGTSIILKVGSINAG